MAKVLVPLAPGCEELEAVTVVDILRRAGVEVVTAGLADGPVKASRGVVLVPDMSLDAALGQDYDLIALPGGMPGMTHLKNDPRILALLKKMAAEGKYTTAICASPAVLAEAGLLAGKRATSYPGFLDAAARVELDPAPVVRDGKVVTSRGPGTAMDFALELVEILAGAAKRDEVEAGLQRPGKY
ncbi:MAG: DJ-1 family glyoxalase III [Sulfuricellaceae bacterium]|jgi:4-methyl-5(b-hydroxyethyl)-thiazole monophosphate biosynthesis